MIIDVKSLIKIEGLNLDYIIKKIVSNNIFIWQVKKVDNKTLNFVTYKKNLSKLFDLLSNKCYNISVVDRVDFAFVLNIFKARVGLCIGLVISILLSTIYSQFVWQIEVVGLESQELKQVYQVLYDLKVNEGNLKYNVDLNVLENEILNKITNLSYVDANICGTTLLINAKEKLPNEVIDTELNPIISEYNGVIYSIKLKSGTSLVEANDKILVGQTLVGNYITDYSGNKTTCLADAKIVLDVYFTSSFLWQNETTSLIRTNNKIITNSLNVFGIKLNTSKKINFINYETETTTQYLCNYSLPIKVITTTHYELIQKTVQHDFDNEINDIIDVLYSNCEEQINISEYELIDKFYTVTNFDTYKNIECVMKVRLEI